MSRLDSWNSLTEGLVGLPDVVFMALSTGRSELLAALDVEELAPAAVRQLVEALRVLMDTNRELQQHAAQLAERVEHMRGGMKGVMRKMQEVVDFALFCDVIEDDDDDE